jgi:hypothetical protein
MKTVGIFTRVTLKNDLKEAGADYIFNDLKEFIIALFGEEL